MRNLLSSDERKMHFAFASDNNYAQHLSVAIASLFDNLSQSVFPSVKILDGGISQENKDKICRLISLRPAEIEFFDMRQHDFSDYKTTIDYISVATYYRLKLPSLLPDIDRVIYLDCDLIVDKDISGLWNEYDDEKQVMAVADLWGTLRDHHLTIGMKKESYYFNAGVILFNLKRMRERGFEQRCVDVFHERKPLLKFQDQDVLNIVCEGDFKVIPPIYNVMPAFEGGFSMDQISTLTPYTAKDMCGLYQKAVIFHFAGPIKPWSFFCKNRSAEKYMKYIRLTAWKDFSYPDTPQNRLHYVCAALYIFLSRYHMVIVAKRYIRTILFYTSKYMPYVYRILVKIKRKVVGYGHS